VNIGIVCERPGSTLVCKMEWVADGFRAAGHDVRLAHSLVDVRAADAECDLLLFDHKGAGQNHNDLAELAPRRKALWLQWYRDLIAFDPGLPLAQQPYVRSFARLMRLMDMVFVKERSLLPEYAALGINAVWLDQACPATMAACQHPGRPGYDVLVLGSTAYKQRMADVRALIQAGLRVLWAGLPGSEPIPPGADGHPWVHPFELPQLISRCAVVLGVDWRSDLDGFTSDRTWLVTGAGACYVRRHSLGAPPVPSFDYQDDAQLVQLVRSLVANPALRAATGALARRFVMANHTYANRVGEILASLRFDMMPARGALIGGH
jgi:hypothetical protein